MKNYISTYIYCCKNYISTHIFCCKNYTFTYIYCCKNYISSHISCCEKYIFSAIFLITYFAVKNLYFVCHSNCFKKLYLIYYSNICKNWNELTVYRFPVARYIILIYMPGLPWWPEKFPSFPSSIYIESVAAFLGEMDAWSERRRMHCQWERDRKKVFQKYCLVGIFISRNCCIFFLVV